MGGPFAGLRDFFVVVGEFCLHWQREEAHKPTLDERSLLSTPPEPRVWQEEGLFPCRVGMSGQIYSWGADLDRGQPPK